jgi:hypothetical protein
MFSTNLDTELQARGQAVVNLSSADVQFKTPKSKKVTGRISSISPISPSRDGGTSAAGAPTAAAEKAAASPSVFLLLGLLVFLLLGVYLGRSMAHSKGQKTSSTEFDGVGLQNHDSYYASKIAAGGGHSLDRPAPHKNPVVDEGGDIVDDVSSVAGGSEICAP